jgi:CheY-like chemotaxis protein
MPDLGVVIAASNLMPSLRERLADEGELLTFADTEPIQALQAILEHRPRLIVLERLFAATPRGAALINRIKTDPQLGASEVRVMSHTGDYMRQVSKPSIVDAIPAPEPARSSAAADAALATAPPATAAEPRQLDWHGTRRAPRHRLRDNVEIQLDGNPATVVDMSIVGAQVVSATILRPNQRVRVSVPTDEFMMRFRGIVAWAKFELPRPTEPPRYRAGIEFTDADAAAMSEFCTKLRPDAD